MKAKGCKDENKEGLKKRREYQLFHLQFSSRDPTSMVILNLIFSLDCKMDSVKQREGFMAFQSSQNLWWMTIIFSFPTTSIYSLRKRLK